MTEPDSDEPGKGEKEMDSWRLALLGDGGVGKTALAVQTYDPTIEDAYRKSTKINDQRCFIEIIDTAGQEEYATIRDQWVWESAAFVLVFSLASLKSLDRIRLFYNTVVRVQRSDPIVILVGNKLDQKRVVPAQEAVDFARLIGATYIETSAKTAHNVSFAFTEPITRLRNKHAHVGASYDLKGRLALPLNPQSIEAPPGAIAAVEAQERARAASGRRMSNEAQNQSFPAGPILEAPMPLNQLLLGRYPEGPTDEPPGYGPGGQTGSSVFEHQLPPGTVIPRSSLQTGTSTPRGGTRSRSGTNASIPASWNQHGTPPVPTRNTRSANIASEESRQTRKMSDPQPSPVSPPKHRPVEKTGKKKGGSLANMLSNRKTKKFVDSGRPGTEKDGNCVIQ